MIEVMQADREAAAKAVKAYRDQKNGNWQKRIRDGECDDGVMVQSFARHRIASQAELIEALENIQQEARRDNRTMAHLLKCISHQVGTALAKAKGEA